MTTFIKSDIQKIVNTPLLFYLQRTHMKLAEYNELISKLLHLGFELTNRPAKSNDNGRWNHNDDMTVIVVEGQVFLREGRTYDPKTLEILERLCPKGCGTFASNSLNELLSPTPLVEE